MSVQLTGPAPRASLLHDVEQGRMPAHRLGQDEDNIGKLRREPIARRGQVVSDVNAGREKVRHHHHPIRPLLDAGTASVVDARFGQLQERRNDDGVTAPGAEPGRRGAGRRWPRRVGCRGQSGAERSSQAFPVEQAALPAFLLFLV